MLAPLFLVLMRSVMYKWWLHNNYPRLRISTKTSDDIRSGHEIRFRGDKKSQSKCKSVNALLSLGEQTKWKRHSFQSHRERMTSKARDDRWSETTNESARNSSRRLGFKQNTWLSFTSYAGPPPSPRRGRDKQGWSSTSSHLQFRGRCPQSYYSSHRLMSEWIPKDRMLLVQEIYEERKPSYHALLIHVCLFCDSLLP